MPARTPMAPRAKPAKVAWAAAPVEAAEVVEPEAEPEAAALVDVASEVDWFALPALVRALTATPVLFWQSALYSADVNGVEVKVMSAHCKRFNQHRSHACGIDGAKLTL